MAVSRVKGSGPETPDIENFPVNDFEDLDSQQQVCPCENLLMVTLTFDLMTPE
jgi:hypothetical protein